MTPLILVAHAHKNNQIENETMLMYLFVFTNVSGLDVVGGKFGSDDQILQGYAFILTHPGKQNNTSQHSFTQEKTQKNKSANDDMM